jgi:hypothetical protein
VLFVRAEDPAGSNSSDDFFESPGFRPPRRIDVFDETGELLGGVTRQTWFAIRRPAGPALFAAANAEGGVLAGHGPGFVHCEGEEGNRSVGALRAELAAGRVYLVEVRVDSEVWVEGGGACGSGWASGYGLLDASRLLIDLRGIPPGGMEWVRVSQAMERGTQVEPAPRGAVPENLREWTQALAGCARGRFNDGCVERNNTMERRHGSITPPGNEAPRRRVRPPG